MNDEMNTLVPYIQVVLAKGICRSLGKQSAKGWLVADADEGQGKRVCAHVHLMHQLCPLSQPSP